MTSYSKSWILLPLQIIIFSPPPVKLEGTIGCPSVRPSHQFSRCFLAMLSYIWMKVGSKLLYKELQIKFDFHHGWPTFSWVIALYSKFCPSNQFSGLFLAMLSHIWIKFGSKVLYEELQIKIDFRHGWPNFSWVIALCLAHSHLMECAILAVHRNNGCRFNLLGSVGDL